MDSTQGNILILAVVGIFLILLFGRPQKVRVEQAPETEESKDSQSSLSSAEIAPDFRKKSSA